MGRPKKRPEEARDARVHIRVRREYADWLKTLATAAKEPDIASLFVKLAAEKAKRLKHTPPPDR